MGVRQEKQNAPLRFHYSIIWLKPQLKPYLKIQIDKTYYFAIKNHKKGGCMARKNVIYYSVRPQGRTKTKILRHDFPEKPGNRWENGLGGTREVKARLEIV